MTQQTLDSIYPPDTFLAPRLDYRNAQWVSPLAHVVEFMTANLISCAGSYPVLVHKAAMSPYGLKTMDRCGVEIGTAIDVYETPEAYAASFRRRVQNGERAALVFPEATEPAGGVLVGSDCLRFLNNKGNIEQLAGIDNVPPREFIGNCPRAERESIKLPVALKIATNEPNGAGLDVAVCRKRRQLNRALKRFAGVETLIAERFIEATHNWCVQFAVLPDGSIREMGASQQICTKNGAHGGNLFAEEERPSAQVSDLARAIAGEGARQGFRGLCGFDILTDSCGKSYAIDLNFRPASSASFIMEIHRRSSLTETMRFARLALCKAKMSLTHMIRHCEDGFEQGWLVPLATFDPDYGGLDPGPARMRAIILGESRKRLYERERLLASRGIEFFRTPTRWSRFRERFGP